MKKTILATFIALFCLTSCGPAFYTYDIERMGQTSTGFETAGKNICVIADSLHINYAFEFCKALNKEYNNTVQLLLIVSLKPAENLKEQMVDLALKANTDIVVYINDAVNIYDTQSPEDKVHSFAALSAPTVSAMLLKPTWISESYRLAVYEGRPNWVLAADKMDERKFQEAIDIWCGLLGTKNYVDKAALEANISTALYLLGKKEIAREWFRLSENTAALEGYATFKKKLNL